MSDEFKKHSRMLGKIASEVEDWCMTGEYTTLDAVRLLKAEVLELRGKTLRYELERKYGE